MRILTIALIAGVALMVTGCQPPEGMGVTTEQFEELKAQVETLKTDVDNLRTALDSLTETYNAHIDKFHKRGGVKAPKPPKPEPPPVQK
jgi:outer membrane murein-binding lipoprotein Lpp